ncbi:MAG: hypothetical protein VKN72_05855 [Nostocales cyanobacterium 94392]|nr:hypothetical protein [Nostocales cyanobacterium 94392]
MTASILRAKLLVNQLKKNYPLDSFLGIINHTFDRSLNKDIDRYR